MRSSQPQSMPRLARANDLTRGIIAAMTYVDGRYVGFDGSSVTSAAGPQVVTTNGVGASFDGGSQYAATAGNFGVIPFGSLMVIVSFNPSGGFDRLLHCGNSTLHTQGWGIQYDNGGQLSFTGEDVGGNNYENYNPPSITGVHVIIARFDGTGNRNVFFDGAPLAVVGGGFNEMSTPCVTDINEVAIGRLQYQGNTYYGQFNSVPLGVLWGSRYLTDGNVADLSSDPWQVFAPRKRRAYATIPGISRRALYLAYG